MRLLIVDDEPMFHQLIFTILSDIEEPFDCCSANDGVEALELIASGKVFDLIVTDLRMPRMDGLQLIDELRRRCSTVPIIMMTGDARPPKIDGVRVLAKPFRIAAFADAVVQAIGKRSD